MFAQYYSTGQDPFSTQWRQIQTHQFQVIYDADFEAQAQLLTHWLMQAYEQVNESMQSKPRKISVMVHSNTTMANGMVTWAPRRMEIYSTPDQSLEVMNWLQHLAIHEYRHVVQVEKMNQGFTKILSWLMGEQATVLPLGLYMPFWFLEGDAVVSETALSRSGRGRNPEFLQGFKALTMQAGNQGYDRSMLGSYKIYVPDHYETGYQLVATNRLYKSSDVFEKKLHKITRRWFVPFGGAGGLRDGKREKYYKFAMPHLVSQWLAENSQEGKKNYTEINTRHPQYESYSFLQQTSGGVVALKKSLYDIPQLVRLNGKGEEKLVDIGYYLDPGMHARDNLAVWGEMKPNVRWEHKASSDIMVLDMENGKRTRLTHGSRYFAPTISPDKRQIAVVEISEQNHYAIVLLDLKNGAEQKRLSVSEGAFPMQPCWSVDGNEIYFIHNGPKGKSLRSLSIHTGEENELVPADYIEIRYPTATADKIYFTGAWSGQNNIFSYDLASHEVTMITHAMYGANYAAPAMDSTITFADYTMYGYKPVTLQQNELEQIALSALPEQPFAKADQLTEMEGGQIVFDTIPGHPFASKKYSRLGHLFHFHSWSFPTGIDPVDQRLFSGVSLMSQNKLSTSFLTLGADFTPENSYERYFVNWDYEGWYPKFSMYFKTGSDEEVYYDTFNRPQTYHFNQYLTGGSMQIPFKIYGGSYYGGIFPSIRGEWTRVTAERTEGTSRNFVDGFTDDYWSYAPEIYFYRYRQQARRDLYPRWGQYLKLGYADATNGKADFGSLIYGKIQFYIPGLFRNHSLILSGGAQQKTHGEQVDEESDYFYNLNDYIGFPRGVEAIANQELYSVNADYRFPLFYPDWNLGSLVYIKRVNMGLFYDFSHGVTAAQVSNLIGNPFDYASCGGSLFFDLNPLRYEVEMRLGIQAGINLNTNGYFSSLILSFSL